MINDIAFEPQKHSDQDSGIFSFSSSVGAYYLHPQTHVPYFNIVMYYVMARVP